MSIILPTALELAEGLEYLHDQGILHGDLSPGNVLLANDPSAPHGFTVKVRLPAIGAGDLEEIYFATKRAVFAFFTHHRPTGSLDFCQSCRRGNVRSNCEADARHFNLQESLCIASLALQLDQIVYLQIADFGLSRTASSKTICTKTFGTVSPDPDQSRLRPEHCLNDSRND